MSRDCPTTHAEYDLVRWYLPRPFVDRIPPQDRSWRGRIILMLWGLGYPLEMAWSLVQARAHGLIAGDLESLRRSSEPPRTSDGTSRGHRAHYVEVRERLPLELRRAELTGDRVPADRIVEGGDVVEAARRAGGS